MHHDDRRDMRVHNTVFMHDGTVREFDCEYGEQPAIARSLGVYWRMETTSCGDEHVKGKQEVRMQEMPRIGRCGRARANRWTKKGTVRPCAP